MQLIAVTRQLEQERRVKEKVTLNNESTIENVIKGDCAISQNYPVVFQLLLS